MTLLRLAPGLVLALAAAPALGAPPPLPKAALAALDSANELLGKTTGDERIVACVDALPFLDIVVSQAPQYAYGMGLAGECYYLTEQYAKAIPLLERYLQLVPEKARKGDVAEKVERAELRLMRARNLVSGRAPDFEPPPPVPEPAPAPVAEVRPPPRPPEPIVAPPAPPPAPPAPPVKVAEPRPEPKPVEHKPTRPAEPPSEPLAKELAVRAGLGGALGVVGVGVELRLGNVGLALGSGGYPLGAGVGYLLPAGPGGVYLDLHAVWGGSTPFIARTSPGLGLGGTVGYDLRLVPWLSVKLGAGVAHLAGRGTGLVLDASAGPVLSF